MNHDPRSTDSLAGAPSYGSRKSVTESPWYWIYLFCTAGLVALLLAGPKYAQRQAQIERNHEDRLRAAQQVWTKTVPAVQPTAIGNEVMERTDTQVPLWPLYVVLIGILGAAWMNLWRTHFQRRAMVAARPGSPTGPP